MGLSQANFAKSRTENFATSSDSTQTPSARNDSSRRSGSFKACWGQRSFFVTRRHLSAVFYGWDSDLCCTNRAR